MSASSVVGLVDTHAHLEDRRLCQNLPSVLSRAALAGVAQIVAIGTTGPTSAAVVEIARGNAGVFAAVGIHPNDAAEATENDWPKILELASQTEVVAIGETGLDRYWDRTPFPLQQEWFDRHLRLACELDRPVVIHCRDCHDDIRRQLRGLARPIRGVMHSFTGNWDEAQDYLDLGLHLSFAGMITFTNKNLDSLREVAAQIPADRLLVETDSPYLSPHPFRGQTNEPARVAFTAQRVAELRGLTLTELATLTTANAEALFRLSKETIDPSPGSSAEPSGG
jgi:TatD DNase family protein